MGCTRRSPRRRGRKKPKYVKAVFTALQGIATSEVAKTEKFAIPQLVMIKLKHKAARPAGKRMMFGKEVKVAAKKASSVVKAFPTSDFKKSVAAAGAYRARVFKERGW